MLVPDIHQKTLFAMLVPEQRLPRVHPLRQIREMINEAPGGPYEAF